MQVVHLQEHDQKLRMTTHSREAVNTAIKVALQKRYIIRIKAGVFDSAAGKLSCAATYSLYWSDLHTAGIRETARASAEGERTHSASAQMNRFKKLTGNPTRERINILTGSGSKNRPEKRFKNQTGIETKQGNETLKQQAEVVGIAEGEQLLVEAGFQVERARDLARRHPLETIKRQLDWLPHRKGVRNRLGLLKAAIENDWEAPAGMHETEQDSGEREFVRHFYAGFAGNSATPVAEPTTSDIEAVRALTTELSRVLPGNPDPAGWGRHLGKLAVEEGQRVPAVAVAVRHRGDRFLVRMKTRAVKQEAKVSLQSREAARESHRNRYEAAYYDFLRSKEAIMAEAKPKELEAFDMERAKKRERDRKSARPWMNEQWFRHFDRDETRLSDLAKHFGLPDFWQWDQDRESNAHKIKGMEFPQATSLAENSTT
ncbi:MAG: hypothetical protein ACI9R3_004408 [Verrucomicrobiales bacterium]|jgi:hypothetical protein